MEKFLFLDLDDTLFHSLRKCDKSKNLTPMAYRKDKHPVSYASDKQVELISFFQKGMKVIPTTARNLSSFSLVDLQFTEQVILNHGAVILNKDGSVNADWDDHVRHALKETKEELYYLFSEIEKYIDNGFKVRVISDFDLDIYLSLKYMDDNKYVVDKHAALEVILNECINNVITSNYYIHFNDNNLSVIPHFIGKEHAVKFLLESLTAEFGEIMSWGMGDSHSDINYMALCDYAIIPKSSQIYQQSFIGEA